MPACDDFQLALEMHRHGAVPSVSPEQIAEHVAGCVACATYRETTKDIATMTTATMLPHESIDLTAIRERVVRKADQLRKRWWPVPLGLAILIALGTKAGFGVDPQSILLIAGLAVWTHWRIAARRSALLVALQGTTTELIKGLRDDVDYQIRQARFGATVTGLVVGVCAATVLAASWDIGRFVALPILALGLVTFVMARARVRQLTRERAQLDA